MGNFCNQKVEAAYAERAYAKRILNHHESSSNKARSVSARAKRVAEHAREVINETMIERIKIQRQFDDAVDNINRTCETKMARIMFGNKNESRATTGPMDSLRVSTPASDRRPNSARMTKMRRDDSKNVLRIPIEHPPVFRR